MYFKTTFLKNLKIITNKIYICEIKLCNLAKIGLINERIFVYVKVTSYSTETA